MENDPYLGLKKIIEELASKINAPGNLLPTYRISDDGALPHIVIDEAGVYHFIVVERGQELEHRQTNALDELLYWVFAGITFSMACKYELRHRVRNQDFRKLLFQHQEQLLATLSQGWKEREAEEHKLILEKSPFDDKLN
ncbi:Imm63 family immunity protein [Flavitalea sp.]|nr:Imm63 family immunity protein [Flavitalea sp.]